MLAQIEQAGGEQAILTRVAAGETITSIAKQFGVHGSTLGNWLNRSPESKDALVRAREQAAHSLADESLEIARATDEDNHRSNKVKLSQLNHLAGKWNRAVYGDTPMVQIGINADQLMLSALQKPLPPRPQHLVVEGETDADNQGE